MRIYRPHFASPENMSHARRSQGDQAETREAGGESADATERPLAVRQPFRAQRIGQADRRTDQEEQGREHEILRHGGSGGVHELGQECREEQQALGVRDRCDKAAEGVRMGADPGRDSRAAVSQHPQSEQNQDQATDRGQPIQAGTAQLGEHPETACHKGDENHVGDEDREQGSERGPPAAGDPAATIIRMLGPGIATISAVAMVKVKIVDTSNRAGLLG